MSNGNKDLGQYWLRQCLVAWGQQGITWTNVGVSSVKSNDIHLRAISQEIPQASIINITLKIVYLQFHFNLKWTNEFKYLFISTRTSVCSVTTYIGSSTHVYGTVAINTLRWRHNGRVSVSNHQSHDCLLNRLFRCRSKKTSKLRVTGLCAGNSPWAGEFPAQMASNAENVSIWWRHHDIHESWSFCTAHFNHFFVQESLLLLSLRISR